MRRIAVPGIAIPIPVLGFGCSALTSMGEGQALQVLATAFDAGVRHFDVARYYGYGESEGLLGRFRDLDCIYRASPNSLFPGCL